MTGPGEISLDTRLSNIEGLIRSGELTNRELSTRILAAVERDGVRIARLEERVGTLEARVAEEGASRRRWTRWILALATAGAAGASQVDALLP